MGMFSDLDKAADKGKERIKEGSERAKDLVDGD